MKKHNGMRPQDVVVLLKIASSDSKDWLMKDISQSIGISASETSESLNRSVLAGLITEDKRQLMKLALLDFLIYGLKYVFPQKPGALVRGMVTAHSAPPLDQIIESTDNFVWPTPNGNVRGQAIEPLYPSVPEACSREPKLYELIALCDVLRIGKARERNIAIDELKKRIC